MPIPRTLAVAAALALGLSAAPLRAARADPPPDGMVDLTVDITGLRSSEGTVWVTLFDRADGFPAAANRALRRARSSPREGRAQVVFRGLRPGTYALSVLHDEDGDRRMDTNILGMPTEGYGASNDARSSSGPPKWRDARFRVDTAHAATRVRVRY